MSLANTKSNLTESDTNPAATEAAAPLTEGGVVVVKPPPGTLNVPSPPKGFVPASTAEYHGALPRQTEVAVLSDAVGELLAFADYAEIFGRIAPPAATVAQIFDAAGQWSARYDAASALIAYCRSNQGLAWKSTRKVLATMKAAFNLAVAADASIATNNPNLVTLFGVARSTSLRGAVTRRANLRDVAEGKVPTRGKRNKKIAKAVAIVDKAHGTPTPTVTE